MKVPLVCYCCSWLLSVRVCISLCVFSCDMSSSDENSTLAANKRKVWQRGSKMSEGVRAQQFPGIMEARVDEMWCIPCGQRIDYKEKSTASKHVKYSTEHQRQVERMEKGITKPGTSADVILMSNKRRKLWLRRLRRSRTAAVWVTTQYIYNSKDVIKFWQSRPLVLREAVAPYLWYPVTGAAIERSFSLAGLVDVKNRQRMGKDLREACVTMFCNGDVEERSAKWQ